MTKDNGVEKISVAIEGGRGLAASEPFGTDAKSIFFVRPPYSAASMDFCSGNSQPVMQQRPGCFVTR